MSVLFITALGMIAFINGAAINQFGVNVDYINLEFAGAIIGLLFYVS